LAHLSLRGLRSGGGGRAGSFELANWKLASPLGQALPLHGPQDRITPRGALFILSIFHLEYKIELAPFFRLPQASPFTRRQLHFHFDLPTTSSCGRPLAHLKNPPRDSRTKTRPSAQWGAQRRELHWGGWKAFGGRQVGKKRGQFGAVHVPASGKECTCRHLFCHWNCVCMVLVSRGESFVH